MPPPHLTKIRAAMILVATLSGCDAPAEADRALPPPEPGDAPLLLPTSSFIEPRRVAASSAERIADETSALNARAGDLRSRADALADNVLTAPERERLEQAVP